MFKTQSFVLLLFFSFLLSSASTIPAHGESEKKDEVTPKEIIDSRLKKIIFKALEISTDLASFSIKNAPSIMSIYLLYLQIKALSGDQITTLQFQKISDKKLDFNVIAKQQQKVLDTLKIYFPKKEYVKKYRFIPQVICREEVKQPTINYTPCQNIKKLNELVMPQGFLFYGPPGTGKTTYAMTIAKELDALFLEINCSNIITKYIGDSEKNVNLIFDKIKNKASKNKDLPIVVFFDEFDSLAIDRELLQSQPVAYRGTLATLLGHFEKIRSYKNVILCVATNKPAMLDEAIKRGERLDKKIDFPLPSKEQRMTFIQSYLGNQDDNNDLVQHIAEQTKNLGYADIKVAMEDAKWEAYWDQDIMLKKKHFKFENNTRINELSYYT